MNSPQQTATDRGVNPYRPDGIGAGAAMTDNAPASPYDPRAKGLDGDMVDAMMKGRWQEGHDTGVVEGRSLAARRYPDVYDDGFATGLATGAQEAAARLASELLPLLQQAGSTLHTVAGKTGSEEIKNLANAQLEGLRLALETHVGRYTDNVAGQRTA